MDNVHILEPTLVQELIVPQLDMMPPECDIWSETSLREYVNAFSESRKQKFSGCFRYTLSPYKVEQPKYEDYCVGHVRLKYV